MLFLNYIAMRMKCISCRHNMHEEKMKTPSIQSIHCENICTKSKSLSLLIALSCGCLCCSFSVMDFKVNTPLSLRYVIVFVVVAVWISNVFNSISNNHRARSGYGWANFARTAHLDSAKIGEWIKWNSMWYGLALSDRIISACFHTEYRSFGFQLSTRPLICCL